MSDEQVQLSKELHRPIRRNFVRRRTVSLFRDDLWQGDLVEMWPDFDPKANNGYRYILMVIDTFTRYGFARPLLNKSGLLVSQEFEKIIEENRAAPKFLHTDRGKEFYCKPFQGIVKKYSISHYSTFSDKKAAICERWNRTMKERMARKQTELNTEVWIDMLPTLLAEYNNSTHSTIGISPIKARLEKNIPLVRQRLAVSKTSISKPKFKIGDQVRISKIKGIFEKGYKPNWSEEIFRIHAIKNTVPWTYIIKDELGEVIEGSFYEYELQITKLCNYYRIEKVLKRRTRNGIKEELVRWKGYDSRFDSWIESSKAIKL